MEDLAHASHTRHREAGRVHTFITGRTFDFTMLAYSPPKAPTGMFPASVQSELIGFYAFQVRRPLGMVLSGRSAERYHAVSVQ